MLKVLFLSLIFIFINLHNMPLKLTQIISFLKFENEISFKKQSVDFFAQDLQKNSLIIFTKNNKRIYTKIDDLINEDGERYLIKKYFFKYSNLNFIDKYFENFISNKMINIMKLESQDLIVISPDNRWVRLQKNQSLRYYKNDIKYFAYTPNKMSMMFVFKDLSVIKFNQNQKINCNDNECVIVNI